VEYPAFSPDTLSFLSRRHADILGKNPVLSPIHGRVFGKDKVHFSTQKRNTIASIGERLKAHIEFQ
jgi:hypothetical protein